MIAAILIGSVGIIVTCIGVLFIVSTAMPSFGGRRGNEMGILIFGSILFFAGIALIFYAGSWV